MLLLGHWLLASDLHVQPGPGTPVPPPYGKDTNWALLDQTVSAMRAADPNPQVVILSGDFLAHRFPSDVKLAETTMARIARTFNAAFPRAQFVIVPGNNDDPCGDYRTTPGGPYFAYLAHLWAPMVNRNGAAPQFERDFAQYGWYSARLPGNARALAIDSVYWSIVYRRCGNEHPDAPHRELAWLSQSLQSLPSKDRAIVVMHIPPGVDPMSTMLTHRLLVVPFWQEDKAAAFVRILSANSSRIAFAQAGHSHRDDFRIFGNVPMLLAPSVSPVYRNNPAFLRLDVGADGTLRDYTPFFYDGWSQTWQSAASFDATFGVRAFTATALESAHERLESDEDLRHRWSDMFVSDSRYLDINASTWRTYWCAQNELASAYTACAHLERRTKLLPIAAGVAAAAVLALLVLLAVRLRRGRRAR